MIMKTGEYNKYGYSHLSLALAQCYLGRLVNKNINTLPQNCKLPAHSVINWPVNCFDCRLGLLALLRLHLPEQYDISHSHHHNAQRTQSDKPRA